MQQHGDEQTMVPTLRSRAPAVAAVLGVGAVFALGIAFRVDMFNGPWYWRRAWLDLDLLRSGALLAPPLLAIAIALRGAGPIARNDLFLRVLLLTLASFALQVLAMLCHPDALARLHAIVTSPVATSYFTDATRIGDLRDWLGGFHHANLELHSSTHPPGPILFHSLILRMAGVANAPLVSAFTIGALASLGIPILWSFARLWTAACRPRLLACALFALLPAMIGFFPEFDQVYPILAMLIVLAWVGALHGSRLHLMLLLATSFVALLFAWNLLLMAAFAVAYTVQFLMVRRGSAQAWRSVAITSLGLVAGVVVLNLLLWLVTGYRPMLAFMHALTLQTAHAAALDRPWLACIVFDPYDFLLGAGMLVAPLLVVFLAGNGSDGHEVARRMTWVGLATIALIDVSGLLRAETARVWLFLQPFVIVPAAIALAGFDRGTRAAVLVLQWAIVVVLVCRLSFISA